MTLKPTADVVSSHPAGAIATASLPSWSTVMLILYNEIVKSLLIQWSYKFNFFMESAMTIFLFLGIVFFVGNGEIDPCFWSIGEVTSGGGKRHCRCGSGRR